MNTNNENDYICTEEKNIHENNLQGNNINNDKKKNKKKVIYLLSFILIFLIAGITIFKIWQSRNQSNYWLDKLAKNGIMEGRTLEEIQRILNEVVEEGMFNISINPDPIFKNGTAEGNIALENIPANLYYTKVTVTLDETGEIIIQTGGIKPGQYIDYIKLSKNLPKGDYPATALFEITDPESLAEIGRAEVAINIHVLN